MTISMLSMACMAVSVLLSIGAPVGLLIFFHRRHGAKLIPALAGALAFVLFAMVLEQRLHVLVLRPAEDGSIALRGRPLLYMLYGALAAGVFEETARFVSFHILKRRYSGIGTALGYGVGHGGIEAILIGGLAMVNNLVLAFMINAGNTQALAAYGDASALVQAMADTQPYLFLVSGLERLLALGIQIGLSVLVFYSVYPSRRWWLFPAAILGHALVDCLPALSQAGVFTNVLLIEGVVALFAAGIVALAVYTHRRLRPEAG